MQKKFIVLFVLNFIFISVYCNNHINIDIRGNINIVYRYSDDSIKNYIIHDDSILEIINENDMFVLDFYKMIYNDSFVFFNENMENITYKYEFLNNKKYMKQMEMIFEKYKYKFSQQYFIFVSIKYQKMFVFTKDGVFKKIYDISSSKYGIGNEKNSNKTPLGLHIIKEKIGDNLPIGTYFKFKKPRGKTVIYYDNTDTDDDLITTRIMHLKGMEKGKNENSYIRHIYIHGTSEEGLIGQPASHGCIRMRNKDIVELYNLVEINTPVYILL